MELPADAKLQPDMNSSPTQANCLKAFVDSLSKVGVAQSVLSPGSRSAPLIIAFGTCAQLESHSVIDERSAGFFALGISKASGFPAAVACTSGTAAANLAPAVHEAREARTPLLVLTADRPPELRAAGDNQTIDQIGVFGSAAKQLKAPEFTEGGVQQWTRFAEECVEASLRPYPGPVHVNVPLWDPLAVLPEESPEVIGLEPVTPFTAMDEQTVELPGGCTVIVAGRDEYGLDETVAQRADALGIPVIADPLSPASNASTANVISNWESIVRVDSWASKHRPDVILRTGDLPTSKPLRQWIKECASAGTEVLHFDPLDSRRDPNGVNTAHHPFPLAPSLKVSSRGDAAWLSAWVSADAKAAAVVNTWFQSTPAESEPRLFRSLTRSMSSNETLFVAASMPIRDLEAFGYLKGGPRSYANRGANGIDGTIATAAGLAIGNRMPTVLVLGDVTFAHDVSSLASLRDVRSPFLMVVINNGGGAIFDNLPIAEHQSVYEEFVFTPPRLDIGSACAAWGVQYEALETGEGVANLWDKVRELNTPMVVEIQIPRNASPAARASLRAEVASAIA